MNAITRSILLPAIPPLLSTRLFAALVCVALAVFTEPVCAAPGDLDVTFGNGGIVTTDFGSSYDFGGGVAVQADGKIVVAGTSQAPSNKSNFAVVRYNVNGSLDTTFGTSGKVTTAIGSNEDVGQCVAIQSDGKIIVAGYSDNGTNNDFAVIRYHTDGSLDTTFNGTGKVITAVGAGQDFAHSVAIQTDGKIVVAGESYSGANANFGLVRYNPDGSLDTSFNGAGKATTDIAFRSDLATGVAIQSDGKIVVAGSSDKGDAFGSFDFAAVRYTIEGGLDGTFNGTGKVATPIGSGVDSGHSVAVQSDGKIVVGGFSSNGSNGDFALVRYNANGSLDTTFNGTGKVTTDIGDGGDLAYGMALQSDGKILVAGNSTNTNGNTVFALVRYNSDGSLDADFKGTGTVTTAIGNTDGYAQSVAVHTDGTIVVAGYSYDGNGQDFAVVRYEGVPDSDGDGIADRFETGTGIYVSPENTGTSPTIADSDGDGLYDGQEVNTYHSNPNIRDTDGDGFDDGFEVATGFNPTSAASTPDAVSSARTAVEYRFNAANGISYRIEASTDLANWQTIETNILGTGGVITRFYSIEGQTRRYFRSRRN